MHDFSASRDPNPITDSIKKEEKRFKDHIMSLVV